MKKVLISWLARNEDFKMDYSKGYPDRSPNPNMDGPTMGFHQDLWDEKYEYHLLLNGSITLDKNDRDNDFYEKFVIRLRQKYPDRKINDRYIQLNSPVDLGDIKQKVDEVLDEYKEWDVDVFVSPGTGTMQAAWFFASGGRNNLNLFHVYYNRQNNSRIKDEVSLDDSLFSKFMNVKREVNRTVDEDGRERYPSLALPLKRVEQIVNYKGTKNDPDVLILGDHGTGKEWFAEQIHERSDTTDGPFLPVNCSSFSDELLMSELFGHEKGAFTGANVKRKGLLEEAERGTIFLDEIGDISDRMQVSLLRVLQEREFLPVGGAGKAPKKFNARIVSATNKDLEQLCREGKFRWDLYYRLHVMVIQLPRLVDRGEDEIGQLISEFNKDYSGDAGASELKFSKEALKALKAYSYPGNVRELQSMIWSLRVYCEKEVVELSDLPPKIVTPHKSASIKLKDVMAPYEKEHIIKVYHSTRIGGGRFNLTKTAKKLDISKKTLEKRLEEYGEWERG